MFRELEILAEKLGLSQGQLLAIAQEIIGENIRTIDLLTYEERCVLIAELESILVCV